MKKLLVIMLVVLIMIVPFSGVLAETVTAKGPDLTGIIQTVSAFIVALVTSVLGWLFKQYAEPYLKSKGLENAAYLAVKAAEAAIGRGKGAEKLETAIDKVYAQGYNFDRGKVVDAVLAAWFDLNLEQIMVGEKKPPDEAV